MKGITLATQLIVAIILALVVLVVMLTLFTGIWTPGSEGLVLEGVKSTACRQLISSGCENPSMITITDYSINNLQTLCEEKLGCGFLSQQDIPTYYPGNVQNNLLDAKKYCCKKVCGCVV